jgi:hypothetical protein
LIAWAIAPAGAKARPRTRASEGVRIRIKNIPVEVCDRRSGLAQPGGTLPGERIRPSNAKQLKGF